MSDTNIEITSIGQVCTRLRRARETDRRANDPERKGIGNDGHQMVWRSKMQALKSR